MADRMLSNEETGALRAALEREQGKPSPEEAACALRVLSPRIGRAARLLAEKRAERRSVRLQALALAGCSALFISLLWLGYQYRAFLLASPIRWGLLLGFCIIAFLIASCLPLILRKEGEKQNA